MPADFQALEARRQARAGFDPFDCVPASKPQVRERSYTRTDYAVVKEFDDGRKFEIVRGHLDVLTAEQLAGRLRDEMSDDDCSQGFNFKARVMGGNYSHRRSR